MALAAPPFFWFWLNIVVVDDVFSRLFEVPL